MIRRHEIEGNDINILPPSRSWQQYLTPAEAAMEVLRAEIAERKRRTAIHDEDVDSQSSRATKYVRRGEQEAQARQSSSLQQPAEEARLDGGQSKEGDDVADGERRQEIKHTTTKPTTSAEIGDLDRKETFNISSVEAIHRLRSKGEPIRLFGESDKERRLRLRALELIQERGEKVGQNDFMRALRGAESSIVNEDLQAKKAPVKEQNEGDATTAKNVGGEQTDLSRHREGVGMDSLLDLGLLKKDIGKVYPIIYYTLKGLLKDWERTLGERPIEVRQSNQGKLVAATQVQSAEYLKPLFKQLRQRSVLPDVLARLAEIVHYIQKREYRHANDSYLQLSIGNAPWPIGVTMVGIHERSGREKIFSSNVAHVLNDEVSRKYIQSLKRLMTFAQTQYPPYLPSMLMG